MAKKRKIIIDASTLNLEDWIKAINNRENIPVSPCCSFPTDAIKEDYFKNIENYSPEEVKDIIRNFLPRTGFSGTENLSYIWFKELERNPNLDPFHKGTKITEYRRRIMRLFSGKKEIAWEGITWTLDLLSNSPKDALYILNKFFLVHASAMPDHWIDGFFEALELIRTKFIQGYFTKDALDIIRKLDPTEFELLVAALFTEMGYKVKMTKTSHDGGIDLVAKKEISGERIVNYIQCKREIRNISVKVARELLGVISDKKGNKGTIVATTSFTKSAFNFCNGNPELELINFTTLNELLNENFGKEWPFNIDKILFGYQRNANYA